MLCGHIAQGQPTFYKLCSTSLQSSYIFCKRQCCPSVVHAAADLLLALDQAHDDPDEEEGGKHFPKEGLRSTAQIQPK